MGEADAGWRSSVWKSLKQNLGGDYSAEVWSPSDQTPSDRAEQSGHYLVIPTIGSKVYSLVPRFPKVRTFRNFLVNISVLACLVDVFVQFLPAVCGPKVL